MTYRAIQGSYRLHSKFVSCTQTVSSLLAAQKLGQEQKIDREGGGGQSSPTPSIFCSNPNFAPAMQAKEVKKILVSWQRCEV